MRYLDIEKYLAETIGLDPESVGQKALVRAIGLRMKGASITDESEYLAFLKNSQGELEALIESVVVPETWFFRDRGPFSYLREHVAAKWKKSKPGRVFKLLSVPCSTGEEPYSIAITLMEAGLDASEFHIDAVDISARALDAALRGIYTKNSFREKELDYQERYFKPTEAGFRIEEQVHKLVQFEQGNIYDPKFPAGRPHYDVIFCRNLLIYMTGFAKRQVLDNLDRLLVEGGLIFTGHTETMLIRTYGYLPVKHSRVFACRKPGKDELEATQKNERTPWRRKPVVFAKPSVAAVFAPRESRRSPANEAAEASEVPARDESAGWLDMARELGNQGALEEAKVLCEKYLQQHRLNSEAYYLMGMLQVASDRYDLAEGWFQKALYLDPNHYPVLVQLYLLYEKKGDRTRAAAFRTRAARAQALQRDQSRQDRK